jgi:8-oxo-dGTP diphosphatase
MILFKELDYPILSKEICWGSITAKFEFKTQLPDEKLISNVSLIPFIEDKCVIMQINNKDWELPGGTLEPSELWFDAIGREAMEELGAELINFNMFGAFYCASASENPYRPHIPHPNFVRIVGFGEVAIIGKPSNPTDGENVTKVEVVDIQEAIRRFEDMGRRDIAELYKMANNVRG